MPSRTLTLAVVVFWLGTSTWIFFREAYPWLRAGEPPPYVFDMSDEVGANVVNWMVLSRGEQVGTASSSISRLPGRIFQLKCEYTFLKDKLLPVELTKLSSVVRLTAEGELRGLACQFKIKPPGGLAPEVVGEIAGDVNNDVLTLTPALKVGGQEQDLSAFLKPAALPTPKRMLNPMHLLSRFPGVRAGQTWKEPVFNFLAAMLPVRLLDDFLLAKVTAEPLVWDGQEVECLKISWFDQGQKVAAVTWVRRTDGLVLQQEALHGGLGLVMVRASAKEKSRL